MLNDFNRALMEALRVARPEQKEPINHFTLKEHETAMNAWSQAVNAVSRVLKSRDPQFNQFEFLSAASGGRYDT